MCTHTHTHTRTHTRTHISHATLLVRLGHTAAACGTDCLAAHAPRPHQRNRQCGTLTPSESNPSRGAAARRSARPAGRPSGCSRLGTAQVGECAGDALGPCGAFQIGKVPTPPADNHDHYRAAREMPCRAGRPCRAAWGSSDWH
jgi:hypothetical protein